MPDVQLKRAYDKPAVADGSRILVDRLWPRGLSKQVAGLTEWLKAVAPSDELRRWYGHDPERYPVFRLRYADELRDPERAAALAHLEQLAATGPVTLLTATRDLQHSQAAVLAQLLSADAARPDERGGDPACLLRRVCQQCGSVADADPPVTCQTCGAQLGAS
ncbi:MAG TPA: DUF488 family protein [Streptosporangiaceae bacterium]|jgi:uncharacterized protein YeaO (DUF488 family)